MGITRASIHIFNNLVGMISREQDESVEASMRLRISTGEARSKLDSNGGFGIFEATTVSELLPLDGIEQHSLVILSLKKLRKEVARAEGESALGSHLGVLRPSKESRVPQNFKQKLRLNMNQYTEPCTIK